MAIKARIDWVDGLKGVCGVLVAIIHYLLAFKPDGFVGWCCIPTEAEKFDYYFEHFPYSIITNGSFILFTFFALISFIPAYKYFVDRDKLSIQRQAKVRYFRLVPATLILCLLSLLFDKIGIFHASEVGEAIGNTWMNAVICDMTLPGAIYNGLIGAFLFGTDYLTVFWCMNYIFLGSYLAYAVILLFGDMKNRTGVYLAFLVVGFFFPWTFSFIAGIAAADVLVQIGKGGKSYGAVGIGLIVIGLLFACIPPVIVPAWLSMDLIYGVGNLFFIIGIGLCSPFVRLLSLKPLKVLGKYSFSIIIAHPFVLFTLSSTMFLHLLKVGIPSGWSTLICVLAGIPLNAIAVYITEKGIGAVTSLIISKIFKKSKAASDMPQ